MCPSFVSFSSASLSHLEESIGVSVKATKRETRTATETVIPPNVSGGAAASGADYVKAGLLGVRTPEQALEMIEWPILYSSIPPMVAIFLIFE